MRRRVVAVVATVVVALLLALPGSAQTLEDWVIRDYDVRMQVTESGDLLVVENIQLDFGSLSRRGIFRYIPVLEPLPDPLPADSRIELPDDADPGDYNRVYEIDAIEVESPSGAPTDVDTSGPGGEADGNLVIRIGDPDVFVTGPQHYVIRYRVRGALNAFDDHDELYWDAVGNGWGVPIERATVRVSVPGIQETACFQGRFGSQGTCHHTVEGDEAHFTSDGTLRPFEGMTIGVALANGAVDVPPPIVDEKPSLARTLWGSAAAWPLTVLLAVGSTAGIAWLGWREGRDRVRRGGATAAGHVDPARAAERRKGLFEPQAVPVQFRPPDDLPPGLLGLIVDERVDDVDISATLVDLAVRGHLRIDELDKGGWFRKADWKLVHGDQPQDEPNAYERILLDGLFDGRNEVTVSDLRGTFHEDYQKAEQEIYQQGQRRRWFARRPDHARSLWVAIGIGVVVLGVGLTILLAALDTRVAVAGVPVVLGGIALAALNGRMPRRTAKGSDLLVRTLGFREFVTRAETGPMEFAEAQNLFVQYLPYAVVFGAVDKWAQAFQAIGVDPGEAVSGFYGYHGPFSLMAFSAGMNDFSSAVGPALSQVPASSGGGGVGGGSFGGGFSGGGGGGGGGGSW